MDELIRKYNATFVVTKDRIIFDCSEVTYTTQNIPIKEFEERLTKYIEENIDEDYYYDGSVLMCRRCDRVALLGRCERCDEVPY